VDADGRPKADLQLLSQMCFDMDNPPPTPTPRFTIISPAPQRHERWLPLALPAQGEGQESLVARMDAARAYMQYEQWMMIPEANGYTKTPPLPPFERELVDGIEFRAQEGTFPLLLGRERELVVIPVGQCVSGVAALGHVSLITAYPTAKMDFWWKKEIARKRGELAAEYDFIFADGTSITQPLRYGMEILRFNDILQWWTPQSRASHTRPALRAVTDTRNETFRLDVWERALPNTTLTEIRWHLCDSEAILLLAGMSVRITKEIK